MAAQSFKKLRARIDRDPARRANVARERAAAVAEITAHTLAEVRRTRAVTQVELAETLELTQPSVSRIEHQGDLFLSTLRGYIEALGGHLEIAAVFDDVRLPIAVVPPPAEGEAEGAKKAG
jgi:DNA-binding XRE family transcriptional regulator